MEAAQPEEWRQSLDEKFREGCVGQGSPSLVELASQLASQSERWKAELLNVHAGADLVEDWVDDTEIRH